jgi:pseudaminic acid cytidylyltransferase
MRIAIIPARGGSKRISRKNIRDFHGKPIIAYALENALASDLFDEVFVSTDDEEIAALSKDLGAIVPVLRTSKNSDDFATTADVLEEVINYYQEKGKTVKSACCIYPTSPLIVVEDLIDAHKSFVNGQFETLISSVEFSFPIQRGFSLNNDKSIQLLHPELINTRSQDLEKTYHDAGAFYFFQVEPFMKNKALWSEKSGAYLLPESKVQDIDSLEDWKLAELKFLQLK